MGTDLGYVHGGIVCGAEQSGWPGPSDWWLMAILSYDAPSLQRLTQSARVSKETVSFDAGEVRPWFPPAVRNALIRVGGGARLAGPTYRADAFVRPPLHSGVFTVVAARYAVLQMDCCGAAVQ